MNNETSPDTTLAEKIDNAVESLEQEMIDFAQGLFRIPTQVPPGNNYRECTQYIGAFMEKIGMKVQYAEVPEHLLGNLVPDGEGLPRISVIGTLKGKEQRPNIHFTGHYDVVPEGTGWSRNPYGAELDNGKIYARGSSDQKSGIVSQIFACYALIKAGIKLNGTYIASATPDEEIGGFGGVGFLVEQGLITKENTDYCVVTECLDADKICIGHRGTMWFEIELLGKQCHGAMPALGISAIGHLKLLLKAIDEKILSMPEFARTTELPIQPPACRKMTLATTYIHSGDKVNTVPGNCKVGFDWRLTPEYSAKWAKNLILSLCDELKAANEGFDYKFREILSATPTLVKDNSRAVKAFQDAGRTVLGKEMEFSLSPGFTDQRFIVNDGGVEQCIIYGPGLLEQAHKADEYVTVDDMKASAKIMALAAVTLLGSA